MPMDLQNIIALHRTRTLPLDGYLTSSDPRTGDLSKSYGTDDIPNFYCTLTWVLTNNFPTGINSDESDAIIVIAQLSDLLPQMLGFDTTAVTVGRLKLDKRYTLLIPTAMHMQLYESALSDCGAEIILYDPRMVNVRKALYELLKNRKALLLKRSVFEDPYFTQFSIALQAQYPHVDFSQENLDEISINNLLYMFSNQITVLCLDICFGRDHAVRMPVNVKIHLLINFIYEFSNLLNLVLSIPLPLAQRVELCRGILGNGKWLNLLLLEIKLNLQGKTVTNILAVNPAFRQQLMRKLPCMLTVEQFIKRKACYLGAYPRTRSSDQMLVQVREFFGISSYVDFDFEDALLFILSRSEELAIAKCQIAALDPDLLGPEDTGTACLVPSVVQTLLYHHALLHSKPKVIHGSEHALTCRPSL